MQQIPFVLHRIVDLRDQAPSLHVQEKKILSLGKVYKN